MFKITREIKIALTAVAAGVLLFVGINFLKGINVFESSNSYYVKFKDIKGLTVSNAVYANGYPVGIVREINYNYSDNNGVVVRIELDKNMSVPRGTTAELEVAMMGGVTMNLLLGQNPTAVLTPFDTLTGGVHQGAMEQASAMMPQVQQMLPKIDSILTNINRLTASAELQQTLSNTAVITAQLKQTTARLDGLMAKDVPVMMAHLNRTAGNAATFSDNLAKTDLNGTVHNVNGTIADMRQMTGQLTSLVSDLQHKLNSKDNSMGALLNDKTLFDHLRNTAANADSLVKDVKKNPKRYVHFSIFGKKEK